MKTEEKKKRRKEETEEKSKQIYVINLKVLEKKKLLRQKIFIYFCGGKKELKIKK